MKRLPATVAGSLALAAALVTAPRPGLAEDIDLYSGAGGSSANPNVLFFLDNTSNWTANSQAWKKSEVLAKCPTDTKANAICVGYVNQIFGADAPGSTTLVQGRIELRAIKLVLNELVCGSDAQLKGKVNVGFMLLNEYGSTDGNSDISGYIRRRVAPMDSSYCDVVLADLDTMDAKITTPEGKGPSSASYDTALYEAFKYFGGWTNPAGAIPSIAGTPVGADGFGPIRHSKKHPLEDVLAFADGASKTTYKSPIDANGACGGNFIILVGNTWPNQAGSTNANGSPDPIDTNLNTRLKLAKAPQIYPKTLRNSDKSDVRFADEWASFLFNTDVNVAPGIQKVGMFTIDVYNSQPDAKQGALLKSMADQSGPNGYYKVGGNLYAMVKSIEDAMLKIAAVNSVFASASLPVSVNAQGTFLNQVFMGVFRPDGEGQQRWGGNLKQYKFAAKSKTELQLVDSLGAPAVDSKGTGFIDSCAVSFWTSDSQKYWETVTPQLKSSCATSTGSVFSDAPDGPLVERGGAGQRLRALGYAARNIRTCGNLSCSSLIDFKTFALLGSELVDWTRGKNTKDGFTDVAGDTKFEDYKLEDTDTRPTVHGEVVHSRPLAINYGTGTTNDVVVYYGAGDGMFRAVNGNQAVTDGNELWAFVAPEHFSKLDRVRTNKPLISYPNYVGVATPTPQPKSYFFDGSIGGYQERGTTPKIWIYPTMRRGGNKVYAFDVSSKPSSANQPTVLWKFGCTSAGVDCGKSSGESQMGQSWSAPVAIRTEGRGPTADPLVVFGGGYDACEDVDDPAACDGTTVGSGIYVMNGKNGPTTALDYRYFGPSSGLDATAGRFVADMTAVDINGDGYIDVIYAVDTRGNLWRINTSNPEDSFKGFTFGVADWKIKKIATVGLWDAGVSERRKFLYAPGVVVLGTQVTVMVGTGDREKPLSTSTASLVNNRFYGIRDDVTDLTTPGTPVIGYGAAAPGTNLGTDLMNVTGKTTVDLVALASFKGWFLDLSTTSPPFEQVVTTPLTIAGVTYFSTYQPQSNNPGASTCRGTGRGYEIDFQTGVLKPNSAGLLGPTTFLTEGIPPSPVGGVVSVDGESRPFCIGCAGVTPIDPKQINPDVKKNRKPVYRFRRIDG